MVKIGKFAILVGLMTSVAAGSAQSEHVTKEELGGLISEYLFNNPKVILAAVENLQKQEMANEVNGAKEAIKANDAAIYKNKNHGSIGDANAKVAIVEFFDYNCSACKYMFKPFDQLRAAGLKDTRIIFVEYPIFGEESQKISRIALAVNQLAPEKYYEFHGKLMQHKDRVDANIAYEYADKMGLKRADLEKELANEKYSKILQENAKLGEALKLRGTPFLIVGDEPNPGALDLIGLQAAIDKAKRK